MPLILHAAWLRSVESDSGYRLFLWAEDLDRSLRPENTIVAPQPRRNGERKAANGRQRAPKIPSHPHQASIGHLRSVLAAEFTTVDPPNMQPSNATVWLPSQDGMPLSRRNVSRDLVSASVDAPPRNGQAPNGSTQRAGDPVLMPWQVTGLAMPAMPSLRFLSHLARVPFPGFGAAGARLYRVRIGNDLLFWSNVAKFAVELLVGEHFLPGMQVHGAGVIHARWLPQYLDTRIEQRRQQLIDSMPPVCRAYDLTDPNQAPFPSELVDHFIGNVVDAAIRKWTADVQPTCVARAVPPLVWMQSLLSQFAHVALPPQPVHELYQEWRHWTERLYLVRDANIRICFVLEEPQTEDVGRTLRRANGGLAFVAEPSAWRLRYFLQARDNPDLMVPAGEVWNSTHGYVLAGGRQIDQPQERLLTGLGVASRLFTPIERSLRSPQPEECLLSTEEAYRFLREIGPLLESSGFGIVLPVWWHAHRSCVLASACVWRRIRTATRTAMQKAGTRRRRPAQRIPATTHSPAASTIPGS